MSTLSDNNFNLLIADSGSTKTDWRLVTGLGNVLSFETRGYNPFFVTSKEIARDIQQRLLPYIGHQISHLPLSIYFYGAGCSNHERCKVVLMAIEKCFPRTTIVIHHDLLGAAIALFGDKPGITAILGTGSNSCLYDGKEIVENVSSLGYILGDEGSGAHIGKQFIKAYLYREVPLKIAELFEKDFQYPKDDILTDVYNKPSPNRFLASFGKFLHRNKSNNFVKVLVKNSFEEFFTHHICKYRDYRNMPFGSVGSIGYYFRDILIDVAGKNKITVAKILKTPIEDLTKFHMNENHC